MRKYFRAHAVILMQSYCMFSCCHVFFHLSSIATYGVYSVLSKHVAVSVQNRMKRMEVHLYGGKPDLRKAWFKGNLIGGEHEWKRA